MFEVFSYAFISINSFLVIVLP